MTTAGAFPLTVAYTAGLGLGLFYFGGLWLTVRRLPAARRPGLLAAGSLALRTGICLFGFYLVMGGRWERLMLCLAGFVTARIRRASGQNQGEGSKLRWRHGYRNPNSQEVSGKADQFIQLNAGQAFHVGNAFADVSYRPDLPAAEFCSAAVQGPFKKNASRLASMQLAERNIGERLEELHAYFRHRRQSTITGELLDIVAGRDASGQG